MAASGVVRFKYSAIGTIEPYVEIMIFNTKKHKVKVSE